MGEKNKEFIAFTSFKKLFSSSNNTIQGQNNIVIDIKKDALFAHHYNCKSGIKKESIRYCAGQRRRDVRYLGPNLLLL